MDTFYIHYANQSGNGLSDIGPYYANNRFIQRGTGLGSFFSSLYNYLRPILSSGLNLLKKQGLKTGIQVINDLSEKKSLKEILKSRGSEALNNIRSTVVDKMQAGSGYVKRKIKRLKDKRGKKMAIKQATNVKNNQFNKRSSKKKKSNQKRILDIFSTS